MIVGESSGLAAAMAQVACVAATPAPVLLLGETGTGKEVLARAIHARSRQAGGPIVRVNCGAIPTELVDSELFGHERGAFTGALAGRKGWFERADGGTLFLDEVGELPLAAQVRILRVLQEGTLERVGASKTLQVNVRVIAATHRNLEFMVTEGRFREDLWYRLNVFPIRVPTLRERPEDLPDLARFLAERAGRRLGIDSPRVTREDLELLAEQDFPGNVRELSSLIERAAILGGGGRLDLAGALLSGIHPPARSLRPTLPPPPASEGPRAEPAAFPSLDDALREHIQKALRRTTGRIEGRDGAARLLGVNPHTLRAKMRRLGIDWASFRR